MSSSEWTLPQAPATPFWVKNVAIPPLKTCETIPARLPKLELEEEPEVAEALGEESVGSALGEDAVGSALGEEAVGSALGRELVGSGFLLECGSGFLCFGDEVGLSFTSVFIDGVEAVV